MEYRLDKKELLTVLEQWNHFLKRKVHLIACGGTAMTLLGVKASTKDVDFMVPDLREYAYLTRQLKNVGYRQITGAGWKREHERFHFDIFRGNRIHTTELLESPLKAGRHTTLMAYANLYIGILNEYDLIISKLMRGTEVDFADCLMLAETRRNNIDLDRLVVHFHEMLTDNLVGADRIRPHIDIFIERLNGDNLT